MSGPQRHEDYDIRVRAAKALGRGGSRAVQPLCSALKDTSQSVRQAATETLVEIGAPAVECLCQLVKDNEGDIRSRACGALNGIGGGLGLPLRVLIDGKLTIGARLAALEALHAARLGPAVRPFLRRMARSDGKPVREAAMAGLETLALLRPATHPDEDTSMLLRPSVGDATTPPEELLRPAEEPEEPAG